MWADNGRWVVWSRGRNQIIHYKSGPAGGALLETRAARCGQSYFCVKDNGQTCSQQARVARRWRRQACASLTLDQDLSGSREFDAHERARKRNEITKLEASRACGANGYLSLQVGARTRGARHQKDV